MTRKYYAAYLATHRPIVISYLCSYMHFTRHVRMLALTTSFCLAQPSIRLPEGLPDIRGPYNEDVYLALGGSQSICELIMDQFTEENHAICIAYRLRGMSYTYGAALHRSVISRGAQLCTDPALPAGYDFDSCDATFFCQPIQSYDGCPLDFLQRQFHDERFRLHCTGENQEIQLTNPWPETVALCTTIVNPEEERKKAEEIEHQARIHRQVIWSDGRLYYAKPSPWIPRIQCLDLPTIYSGGGVEGKL